MISPKVSFKNLSSVENLAIGECGDVDCDKILEMASVILYPILLSTEVLLLPFPHKFLRSFISTHWWNPHPFWGFEYCGRSSLQQREGDWRHLFCCISADGCLVGHSCPRCCWSIPISLLEHIVLNLERNGFYHYNCSERSSFGKESKLVTYIFIDVTRVLTHSH